MAGIKKQNIRVALRRDIISAIHIIKTIAKKELKICWVTQGEYFKDKTLNGNQFIRTVQPYMSIEHVNPRPITTWDKYETLCCVNMLYTDDASSRVERIFRRYVKR